MEIKKKFCIFASNNEKYKNMNENVIKYIKLGVYSFIVILVIGLFMRINYLDRKVLTLKQDLIEMENKNDSYKIIIDECNKKISEYQSKDSILTYQIDSLERIKNKIIIKKDNVNVSSNFSEGVITLKSNLNL